MTIQGSKLLGNTWVSPSLTVADDGVVVENPRTYGVFPVSRSIPFQQIASVQVKRGLFSSDLVIETTGGARASIAAVSHDDATRVVDVIRDRMRGR